jgi:hypothetical protein
MNIGEPNAVPLRPAFPQPVVRPPAHEAPAHHHHHQHHHHDDFHGAGHEWEQHVHGAQPVPLPPEAPASSNADFVKGLYQQLLGRAPDPEGYHAHMSALEHGASREDVMQAFFNSPEFKAREAALPTPAAPVVPAANLPPITIDLVKDVARQYVAQHPAIADAPSYEDTAAVAQLREGVIAALQAKGYKAGRILGPDGKPYDQMVAFGNPNDPQAQAYRVTAGGARISEAINVGYTDTPIPWGDVH